MVTCSGPAYDAHLAVYFLQLFFVAWTYLKTPVSSFETHHTANLIIMPLRASPVTQHQKTVKEEMLHHLHPNSRRNQIHLHYLHLSFIPQDKPLATVISSVPSYFSLASSPETQRGFFLTKYLDHTTFLWTEYCPHNKVLFKWGVLMSQDGPPDSAVLASFLVVSRPCPSFPDAFLTC